MPVRGRIIAPDGFLEVIGIKLYSKVPKPLKTPKNRAVRRKYGNQKFFGFDSKGEARRYAELQQMQDAGEIHDLQRQVKFQLLPVQREPDIIGSRGGRKPGKVIERAVTYIADFVYYNSAGEQVVEDYKGFETPEYILKRKLLLYIHGIRLVETKAKRKGGNNGKG